MRSAFLIIVLALTVSSCSNYYTFSKKKTVSLTPDYVRLDIDMDDFEYLGKTEISVRSRTYLGVIQVIDSINNKAYNFRNKNVVRLVGPRDIRLSGQMRKAAYKVLEEFPEATYYLVANEYRNVHQLFLGKRMKTTLEIQAFKYKIEN